MAGFVGFMAAANYETIGAPMASSMYPTLASGLSAPEVWDAIPFLAKLQIIGAIGIFEHISEDKNLCADRLLPPSARTAHTARGRAEFRLAVMRTLACLYRPDRSPHGLSERGLPAVCSLAADGKTHYMRGGTPGYMPTFKANVHPCPLNLWDPFGARPSRLHDPIPHHTTPHHSTTLTSVLVST